MPESAPRNDLEALIFAAQKRQASRFCWARNLEGDAEVYVRTLETIDKKDPGKVNRREVQRALNENFGIKLSVGSVQGHFRGDCSCVR